MNPHDSRKKLLTRASAAAVIGKARERGESIVFTNGCFDLLHVGHIQSLEQARRLGDRLVVALNSDSSIRSIKGPSRPIIPLTQRMRLVAGLACVDWVVCFRGRTPLSLIQELKPDILAKGGDWKLDEIVGKEEVESWGGRVARLDEIEGIRTSQLIRRIRS